MLLPLGYFKKKNSNSVAKIVNVCYLIDYTQWLQRKLVEKEFQNIYKLKDMKILKLREVKTPTRGTKKSAGIDFYVPDDFKPLFLNPGHSSLIPSGIKAKIPEDHALIAFNKSGVAINKNLQVGACVVDEDYQGEIHLHVTNIGDHYTTVDPGEKLVQFLLVPISYNEVEVVIDEHDLFSEKTERGEGGFGSTGKF